MFQLKNTRIPVVLYLGAMGDTIKLKTHQSSTSTDNSGTFRDINYETDNIHPILKECETVNTNEDVLSLLSNIQGSESCRQSVEFYHKNCGYWQRSEGHYSIKGAAHQEPLEEMIEFVEKRIEEQNNSQQCAIL